MAEQRRKLTVFDRSAIELRLRDGWGVRAIARDLDRSPGVINRHGGASIYQAEAAVAQAAVARRLTGRKPALAQDGARFGQVAKLLHLGWSPEQISGRRQRMEAGMERASGLSVSHETIYTAIYALPCGELRRELISYLRQDKPPRVRKPKGSERRGKLCNMTTIKERPEDVAVRLVPGHWQGDLILGAGGGSAIDPLVERTRRFVVLVHMPTCKSDVVASAFAGALNAIPPPCARPRPTTRARKWPSTRAQP
jgi:transposase, IS30 family